MKGFGLLVCDGMPWAAEGKVREKASGVQDLKELQSSRVLLLSIS